MRMIKSLLIVLAFLAAFLVPACTKSGTPTGPGGHNLRYHDQVLVTYDRDVTKVTNPGNTDNVLLVYGLYDPSAQNDAQSGEQTSYSWRKNPGMVLTQTAPNHYEGYVRKVYVNEYDPGDVNYDWCYVEDCKLATAQAGSSCLTLDGIWMQYWAGAHPVNGVMVFLIQ